MEQLYLRIENSDFCFLSSLVHEIVDTDIPISKEDHQKFLDMQGEGVYFKLKTNPSGNKLMDYFDEIVNESVETFNIKSESTNKNSQLINSVKMIIELMFENNLINESQRKIIINELQD